MAQDGARTGDDAPAFNRVLYVTNNSTDQWFQPGGATSSGTRQTPPGQMDNVNQGTMAERLAHCAVQVGCTDTSDVSGSQIGLAVKPNTLETW